MHRLTLGEKYWVLQPFILAGLGWAIVIALMATETLTINYRADLDGILNVLLLFGLLVATVFLPWNIDKRVRRADNEVYREARSQPKGHTIQVVPDGGRVLVYEVKRERRGAYPFRLGGTGLERSRLSAFDAEHEAERAIEYVDQQRERIRNGPTLSDRELTARALSESLNA